MEQHLSDLQQELSWDTLINRQQWLGFTTPQAAYAWRQLEMQQMWLMNRAKFGATSTGTGYTTPDQYLTYLQKDYTAESQLSSVLKERTGVITDLANAYLAYDNALHGTTATLGSLSEEAPSSGIKTYGSVLSQLPGEITTTLQVNDDAAVAKLAAYRALLAGVPREVSSTEVLSAAYAMGGVPIASALPPEEQKITVSYAGQYQEQFSRIMAEVADLSRLKAEIPVSFDLPDAAAVAAFVASLPAATERVNLAPEGGAVGVGAGPPSGAVQAWEALSAAEDKATASEARFVAGAKEIRDLNMSTALVPYVPAGLPAVPPGGGGGGQPPVTPPAAEEPPDDAAAKWEALSAAEKDAGNAAAADAIKFAALNAAAAGDADAAAKLAYTYQALGMGAKDAGDVADGTVPKLKLLSAAADTSGIAALSAGGAWGGWTRQITLFGGAFGGAALVGAISVWSLALHFLIDTFIVAVPAILGAAAALGAFAVAAEPAALDVIAHVTGLHTALDALGTGADYLGTDHIGPLTTQMGSLNAVMKPMPITIRSIQAAMAPTVVTLFGAAFSSLGSHMQLVQQVVQKTGTYIEDAVVKVQNALSSPAGQRALTDFIGVAAADLKILLGLGESILKIFGEFVQAGQMTHVAELIFEALGYALSVLQKAIHALGPDVLALGIAFFSIVHYGGTLITVLQSTALWMTTLLSKIPVIGGFFGQFAAGLGASNDQLIKMGQLTPDMELMSGYFAKGDLAAIGMANSIGLTHDQLVKVVAQNPDVQAMAAAFGLTNEQAAAAAIGITASGKSLEQAAADSGKLSDASAAAIGDMEGLQKQIALTGVVASSSMAEADTAVAGMGGAAVEGEAAVGAFQGAWASFSAFLLANPVIALASLTAAVLLIIHDFQQADGATKNFISGLQSGLASVNASQGFALILSNTAAIGTHLQELQATSRNSIGVMAQGWSDLSKTMNTNFQGLSVFGKLWTDFTEILGHSTAQADTTALLKEMTAEQKDWSTEVQASAGISQRYGVTVSQAFALMDLAGVKAGDDLATQTTKVNDLIAGWTNMGVAGLNTKNGMNQLGSAINSVTLASELQNSQITTLTGDYTAFLGLVTGGQTTFETFAQGILTIGTDAGVAGASFTGLNTQSLTLRQAWEGNLTAGQSLYNNLVLQNAAAGNNAQTNAALAASGRDIVNTLLAQGGATTESIQGAYALAQTMGYTGKATYNALLQWSGGNQAVAKTTADLNTQVGYLQTGSSNLNTDVLNLAAAINTNLTQAIAQGLVDMPKITQLVSNVAQQVEAARGSINKGVFDAKTISTATSLENALVEIYGTTPAGMAQAKAEFETVFTDLGIKKSQADALWASIAGGDQASKPAVVLKPPQFGPGAATDALNQLYTQAKAAPPLKLPPPFLPMGPALQNLNEFTQKAATPPSPDAWQRFVKAAMAPPSIDSFLHFFQSIGGLFTTYVGANIGKAWATSYAGFLRDVQAPLYNFFNGDIPNWAKAAGGHLAGAWTTAKSGFLRDVQAPVYNFFNGDIPNWAGNVGKVIGHAASSWWASMKQNWVAPLADTFLSLLPGWLDFGNGQFAGSAKKWGGDFNSGVIQPIGHWFTATLPANIVQMGQSWLANVLHMWAVFNTDVVQPVGHWIDTTLPAAIVSMGQDWLSNVLHMWAVINSDVIQPIAHWITVTLPANIVAMGQNWLQNALHMWDTINNDVVQPVGHWLDSTLPDAITSLGQHWLSNVRTMWNDFYSNIVSPMGNWLSNTLPNAIEGSFRNAVNFVITDVINKVIDFINSVTGVVGVPKIGHVQTLASGGTVVNLAGGSVAGTGDEDGTHIIAMGGEYMLRKPARMALEQAYGPNFLNRMNQADQWLGSGSRGNFASQGRPMATGGEVGAEAPQGYVAPLGGHAASLHAGAHISPMASGGEIVAEAEKFVGAPYLYGGTTPEGWDCSGFVQYVLDQEGFHPPRTSEAQYSWVQHIAQSQLLPGNLVFAQFPGDNASPGHVGFYVGGDNVLSAEDPQLGTGYSSLGSWGGSIVGYGAEPGPGLLGQIGSFLGGAGSAVWQSVEGLLNAAGSALSGNLAPLAKYITGGASELLKLAQQGSEAVFNAIWSSAIQPLVNNVIPGGDQSAVGSVLEYVAASIKTGIDAVLGAKDKSAQSSAASAAAATGAAATAGDMSAAQIETLWIQEGGPGSAAANMAAIAYAESGDNPSIVQQGEPPGLTGWGLYQITPTSGITQNGRFGNLLNAANNTRAAISLYDSSGYGPWTSDPVGSSLVASGLDYAAGGVVPGQVGEVVPDLAGFTAGQAHNILTAANMVPTAAAGQKAGWYVTGTDPAAGTPAGNGTAVAILASAAAKAVPITVPDLMGFSAGQAHNILVAGGLVPTAKAGQQAYWIVSATAPVAGTVVSRGTRVSIITQLPVPDLTGYSAGSAHNALVAAGLVPKAAAGQKASWYVTGTTPAAGTMVDYGSAVTILAAASVAGMTGAAAAGNWPAASAALAPARNAQAAAFWDYLGVKMPASQTVAQWETDYSDRLILAWNQNVLYGDWLNLQAGLDDPAGISGADWSRLQGAVGNQADWIAGTPNVPAQYWPAEKTGGPGLPAAWPSGYKPGSYAPSSAYRKANAAGPWNTAVTTAEQFGDAISSAQAAWTTLYGPQGTISTSIPTPGLQVIPSGGGPITVNLEPLITGGPQTPVMALQPGSLSATGSGFSGGGTVGLSDVAGMFALGGPVPMMPPVVQPGLAGLSGSSGAQEHPRTVSAAASATGDRVGVKVGNITINNAIPEKPSDSITRSSNRLAFLAGRGPV